MSVNLNTRYIRYLLAVADEGSFSRAAVRLSVSQPAISRRIKMLEDELGFELLERLPRQVVLTPEGRAMLPAFRDLVDSAAETGALVQKLVGERASPPRIGVAVYASQPERSTLLADFEEAYPNAVFEIETGYTRALVHGLWEGDFDLLAISSPIPDARFEYIILRWFQVQVIVPRDSPLAALDAVPIPALRGQALATRERSSAPKLFDQMIAPLQAAGAQLVFPDDQGKLGILAHAVDHEIAVISSFDEYSDDEVERAGMVARPLENVGPVAALMLLRIAREGPSRSDRLWQFARNWVSRKNIVQKGREDRLSPLKT